MKKSHFLMLILLCASALFAQAGDYRLIDVKSGKGLKLKEMVKSLQKYDVIFFGEFHDDAILHKIEADLLPLMALKSSKLAVSMEMFERDNQAILNDYLENRITENELKNKARLWPNYNTDYKPLIEYAKQHSIPVIAANIPRRYASMVARNGLAALDTLSVQDKAWFMRKPVILNDTYKEKFLATMQESMGSPKGMPGHDSFMDNIYAAQCIKDDTMAESISDFIKLHPGTKVIHYNGDFHSAEHLGTAQKLALMNPDLKIAVITPVAFQQDEALNYQREWQGLGDFLVLLHRYPGQDDNRNGYTYSYDPVRVRDPLLSHDISVEFLTDLHQLKGSDVIWSPKYLSSKDTLLLSPYLKITSIKQKNKKIKYTTKTNEAGYQEVRLIKPRRKSNSLTITYEGKLYDFADPQNDYIRWGMISGTDKEGIYLPIGAWYPTIGDGLANYTVTAICKAPTRLVCSGREEIMVSDDNHYQYTWRSEYPYEGVCLFGGNYVIKSMKVDNTRLSVYFKSSDTGKAPQILSQMQTFYQDYSSLFGKYPGSSMNLIENFLPEGMSYPDMYIFPRNLFQSTDIMLSSTVLGNEVCRSWWGNNVYSRPNTGNWTDVLNNFVSNYYWLDMHGKPGETDQWRRNALQDINFMLQEKHYPLKDFCYAETKRDAVIGFQKGALAFYDIYQRLGRDTFFAGLKWFLSYNAGDYADWDDLMAVFSQSTSQTGEIEKVSQQWLNRTDIPTLSLGKVSIADNTINAVLKQSNSPFDLRVPVVVTYKDRTDTMYVYTDEVEKTVQVEVKGEIKSLEIDPGYQVIRKLQSKDMPFCLKRTLQENPLIVIPESGSKFGEIDTITSILSQNGFDFDTITADRLDTVDWRNRSLIVFGSFVTNSFFKRMQYQLPTAFGIQPGSFEVPSKSFTKANASILMSYLSPFSTSHSLSFWFWNAETAVKSMRVLFKNAEHSWQVFDLDSDQSNPILQGEIIQKDANPMRWDNK